MNISLLQFVPLTPRHARLLHQLYRQTPRYFKTLGSAVPSLQEVRRDVEISLTDLNRRIELIYNGPELIGSVDYKLEFPHRGDITINLLLIRDVLQGQGWGQRCVRALEKRLPRGRRLLASVLGERPRVVAFWKRQGFAFATDARPMLTWYAKVLP